MHEQSAWGSTLQQSHLGEQDPIESFTSTRSGTTNKRVASSSIEETGSSTQNHTTTLELINGDAHTHTTTTYTPALSLQDY